MADTSLIFNIIARDKVSATLERMKERAAGVGRSMAMALGPGLAPVLATSTVALTSLGGALAGAGLAAGVFGGVAKTAMTEVNEQATKVSDLTDKIQLYGTEARLAAAAGADNSKYLDKQAEATLELRARLANLPPETRNATMAFIGMKQSWQGFVETNKPATFSIMATGYKLIGTAIGQLQPFFDQGARAARQLEASIMGWVNGGGIERFASSAGPALDTLTNIVINVGTALARTFGKIGTGTGQGILDWIDRATAKWAAWAGTTNQKTGLDKFINYAQTNGPRVVELLGNIATAAMHIAQATSPIAPISFAIASSLAKIVAAIPQPWLTAIIAGFIAFNLGMRAYAVGAAIAEVATADLTIALLTSPITWIVLAIAALVAIIVLVATKTRFFQTVWNAVWGFLKGVGAWFAGPFAGFFVSGYHKVMSGIDAMKRGISVAVQFVKAYFQGMWNFYAGIINRVIGGGERLVGWFRSAPGRIRGALGSMFSGLWTGFRGAVNNIIGGWNRLSFTVGGGSFLGMSIPSFTLSTPDLPYLATGGRITRDGLFFGHAGEEVVKKAQVTRTGYGTGTMSGGGGATLTIKGDGSRTSRFLLELLREAIRDKGGDPVKVLTPA